MSTQGTEWRNQNQYRRYPFTDDANMTLSDGTVLPNDVILDARLTVYLGGGPFSLIRISRVVGTPTIARFTFILGSVPLTVEVPDTANLDQSVTVNLNASDHAVTLTVLFGTGALTVLTPGQTVTAEIPVLPGLVVEQTRHQVRSVQAIGGPALTGSIALQAGYNCLLDAYQGQLPTLRIGAAYGAGRGPTDYVIGSTRRCEDTILRINLLRINGLTGSASGDFSISGGVGVTVKPVPAENKIVITGLRPYTKVGCSNVT